MRFENRLGIEDADSVYDVDFGNLRVADGVFFTVEAENFDVVLVFHVIGYFGIVGENRRYLDGVKVFLFGFDGAGEHDAVADFFNVNVRQINRLLDLRLEKILRRVEHDKPVYDVGLGGFSTFARSVDAGRGTLSKKLRDLYGVRVLVFVVNGAVQQNFIADFFNPDIRQPYFALNNRRHSDIFVGNRHEIFVAHAVRRPYENIRRAGFFLRGNDNFIRRGRKLLDLDDTAVADENFGNGLGQADVFRGIEIEINGFGRGGANCAGRQKNRADNQKQI